MIKLIFVLTHNLIQSFNHKTDSTIKTHSLHVGTEVYRETNTWKQMKYFVFYLIILTQSFNHKADSTTKTHIHMLVQESITVPWHRPKPSVTLQHLAYGTEFTILQNELAVNHRNPTNAMFNLPPLLTLVSLVSVMPVWKTRKRRVNVLQFMAGAYVMAPVFRTHARTVWAMPFLQCHA